MTRPITGSLGAYLAGTEAVVADCLMVERRDGTRFGFSSIDVPVTADLGAGDESYAGGMSVAALTLAVGLDASSAEFRGPIGPVVTRDALLGGAWDDAEAWFFRASPDVAGIAPLLHGRIREAREDGDDFVMQLRGEADRFNQTVGDLIIPYCNADFGDARCTKVVDPVAATVTAVSVLDDGSPDALRFTVSFSGGYADGYFDLGTATFLTGDLAGDAPIELFGWASGGGIVLFEPLSAAPAIGDTLELRQGCAKTRAACMAYDNILNMRAFTEVPGSDQVLKYQVPDDAGA